MPIVRTKLDNLDRQANPQLRGPGEGASGNMMERVKELEEALARHHARVLNEPVPETLLDVISKFDTNSPKLG